MKDCKLTLCCIICLSLIVGRFVSAATENPVVSGELKKWHKVTITFTGPETSEAATICGT
jgi:hypothetical protein